MTDKPTPPKNHMDPATKDAYLAELEAFVLETERSVNKMDSAGYRCLACNLVSNHDRDCRVGKMCDRIRTVREAHRLLGLG